MSRMVNPVEGFSVGSRTSWGAILAGVVVAFAVAFLLNLLGTAIGLSVLDRAQPANINTGANLWAIVTAVISLFLGGWVTSRFTIGEGRLESVFNGAIVWGVSFLLLLWMVSVGLGMGYGTMVAASHPQLGRPDARADTAARAAWWAFAGTLLSMLAAIGGCVAGAETMHARVVRYERTGTTYESPGGKPTV